MTASQLRRLLLIPAVSVLLICTLLLLNVTASNPTGRRYSSASPDEIAAELNLSNAGEAAEIALARDLGVPRNDSTDGERVCICNIEHESEDTPPNRCNSCAVYHVDASITIPDFITDDFIADAKDYRSINSRLLSTDAQLRNFLLASERLNRPLYIFMPHAPDGRLGVTDNARDLIAATGGGVIPYFTYEGYVDPVDRAASIGVVLALLVIGGVLVWTLTRTDESGGNQPMDSDADAIDKAADSTEKTEAFMDRIDRLSRRDIDEDDARHDDIDNTRD